MVTSRTKKRQQNESSAWIHVIGWAIMIGMTIFAFLAVGLNWMDASLVVPIILGLMFIQVFMQLYIFMHLGEKGHAFQNLFILSGIGFAIIFSVGLMLMV